MYVQGTSNHTPMNPMGVLKDFNGDENIKEYIVSKTRNKEK